ncbi:hypothetical protein ElyMa_001893800 [Elysia marginata]|uniref:Secreted protein n=1 Tax=Elysia marginata TaxID=1093978 RepID=A0AAV4EQH1_9GAST|nr:hypothetical protein ElyMa_001893800 [Elysia marginata]
MLLVGFLATSFVFSLGTGLASGDECADQIEACRDVHWTPFEDDPFPHQRCDALKAFSQCLREEVDQGINCTQDVLKDTLVLQVSTCYITANSSCTYERDICRDKYEADLDTDPIRACSRAAAWVSCLRHPDVVFLCGYDLPKDVQDIWYDRCYITSDAIG